MSSNHKHRHLSLRKFLALLRELNLKWTGSSASDGFGVRAHTDISKADFTERQNNPCGYMCPLTAVAFAKTNKLFCVYDWDKAAEVLGVRPSIAEKIARAADGITGEETPKLRPYRRVRKLLMEAIQQ